MEPCTLSKHEQTLNTLKAPSRSTHTNPFHNNLPETKVYAATHPHHALYLGYTFSLSVLSSTFGIAISNPSYLHPSLLGYAFICSEVNASKMGPCTWLPQPI